VGVPPEDEVKKRSIPAFVLFLYDCARVGFVFAIVKEQAHIPLVAANVLFPIAGFFLYDNPRKYREYVPLYAAGKAIGVFAGNVWLFATLKTGAVLSFSPDGYGQTVLLLGVLGILAVTDTLSILARLLIGRREPIELLNPVEPVKPAGDTANCE
jgi:hypothetical protein